MPRPKTGNDFTMRVRISSALWEQLERLAQEQNTTPSEIVRRQLRELLSANSEKSQVAA